jgi:hypothetical protein
VDDDTPMWKSPAANARDDLKRLGIGLGYLALIIALIVALARVFDVSSLPVVFPELRGLWRIVIGLALYGVMTAFVAGLIEEAVPGKPWYKPFLTLTRLAPVHVFLFLEVIRPVVYRG